MHPRGLAFDKKGNLYLTDTWTVRKITRVGTNWILSTIAGQPHVFGSVDGTNTDALFNNVAGITTDSAGNVYVTDVSNNTIRKLTPAGSNWVVTTIAGNSEPVREANILHGFDQSLDGTNTEAHFFTPTDIVSDSHGSLYVVDSMTSVIRKIARQGTNWITTT